MGETIPDSLGPLETACKRETAVDGGSSYQDEDGAAAAAAGRRQEVGIHTNKIN